jgi:lactate 2-monooxygenase
LATPEFVGAVGRAVQTRIYQAGALGRRPRVPVSPDRLQRAAQRRMSKAAWAYVAGSAGQQRTAQANQEAFRRWQIVPRMLRDVSERDNSVELFGERLPSPMLLAPIGVLEMVHPGADRAVAEAAAQVGLPMVMSTQASVPMERIARSLGSAAAWYQLYWSRERELVASFVRRAEAIGSKAIVVTLDTNLLGWRPRDLDLGHLPFIRGMGIAQYTSDPVFQDLVRRRAGRPRSATARRAPTPGMVRTLLGLSRRYPGPFLSNLRGLGPLAAVETFLDVFANPALTWQDLGFLRELTDLPIVLKGIQHPDDARKAVDCGVDGIVVSNHGGRQVDGAVASLAALPRVAQAVGGAVPVLFDSGVRSGADVVKAIALGATAVMVGRPYVYGLALAGATGVAEVLRYLMAEFDLTMALAGCSSVEQIDAGLLQDERE